MNLHITVVDWITIIGALVTAELAIANGTIKLTNAIPDAWVPRVQAWCGILAALGTGIITALSRMVGAFLVTFVLAALLIPCAQAQVPLKTPQQIISDLKAANARLGQKAATAVGIPAADHATAVPCDFKMLIHLTPDNLLPTVKECLSDVNQKLVKDTQRALDSAKAYGCTPSQDGSVPAACKGDGDAINCLTPALAIFKAGVQIPAQDEVPAVMSADGTTVVTPEKAAVPAQDPGPILLYQKYGEFTQAGALTSCQTWFNKPINATAAAGIAGVGTAVAGVALLAPK